MSYEIIQGSKETIIQDKRSKVCVSTSPAMPGTAFALGTLYEVKGGFVPMTVYQFQAVTDTDAENLKKIAVFFFACLFDTEHYVVEIPRDSALFPQEAQRIFGYYDHERAI